MAGLFPRVRIWMVLASACSATGLLVAALTTATPTEARTAIGSNELSASRGGMQNLYSGTFLCNSLTQGLTACTKAGDPCTTCQMTNYSDTGSTTGGGMDPGMPNAGSCGDIYNGTCAASLVCNANLYGDTGNACTKPPSMPTRQ